MISGALSRRIYLQEPVEVREPDGSIRRTWSTMGEAWAKVEALRGREKWVAKSVYSETMSKFTCRHVNGLNQTMRVILDERPYQIVSIIDRTLGLEYEIYAKADAPVAVPPVDIQPLLITDVSFTVGKTLLPTDYYLRTDYTTSETAKCLLDEMSDPESPVVWFQSIAAEHATHSHNKTGLLLATQYKIRISCVTDEGLWAYSPSSTGYYLVETVGMSGTGGGIKDVIYQE
jgi:SPP1 family predicted phage head-tail adaptor